MYVCSGAGFPHALRPHMWSIVRPLRVEVALVWSGEEISKLNDNVLS
jgi:hypothetical protein